MCALCRWLFLSLVQSYSLAYANSREQQRCSAFKIRPCLFVFRDDKKRKVWNYWSYNTFCYRKAVQNDSVSHLGRSELFLELLDLTLLLLSKCLCWRKSFKSVDFTNGVGCKNNRFSDKIVCCKTFSRNLVRAFRHSVTEFSECRSPYLWKSAFCK